jgi:hypothetical protein
MAPRYLNNQNGNGWSNYKAGAQYAYSPGYGGSQSSYWRQPSSDVGFRRHGTIMGVSSSAPIMPHYTTSQAFGQFWYPTSQSAIPYPSLSAATTACDRSSYATESDCPEESTDWLARFLQSHKNLNDMGAVYSPCLPKSVYEYKVIKAAIAEGASARMKNRIMKLEDTLFKLENDLVSAIENHTVVQGSVQLF